MTPRYRSLQTPVALFILFFAVSVMIRCSLKTIHVRLPTIETAKGTTNTAIGNISISFSTVDPASVPDDYSLATATLTCPLITGWSAYQTAFQGETFSYVHPLLGTIKVTVREQNDGTVTYSGTMNDNHSHFSAVISAGGALRYEQLIVTSLVETAQPPVQSYQVYVHSTFTGLVASNGGYSGLGNAVTLASTIAYLSPPNPAITTPTGTEGYLVTYSVKSNPSKSFFGIEFYPWGGGYSTPTATMLSLANSSVYDREVKMNSDDPRAEYRYMFYWHLGSFYQIPWGFISSESISDTWVRY
jgi:hypothetical protein